MVSTSFSLINHFPSGSDIHFLSDFPHSRPHIITVMSNSVIRIICQKRLVIIHDWHFCVDILKIMLYRTSKEAKFSTVQFFTQAACSFLFLFAQYHIKTVYHLYHNEPAFLLEKCCIFQFLQTHYKQEFQTLYHIDTIRFWLYCHGDCHNPEILSYYLLSESIHQLKLLDLP